MKALAPKNTFPIYTEKSEAYNFPLPEAVTEYYELELLDSYDFGIHRIHFYKVTRHFTGLHNSTLAHIHRFYAQWREDHFIPNQIFLR